MVMMGLSKGLLGRTVARDLDVLAILQINYINRLVWFTLLTFITVCLLGSVKRMIKISYCNAAMPEDLDQLVLAPVNLTCAEN